MDSELVYSTLHGRMCPSCNNPLDDCNCKTIKPVIKNDGFVRISRETKGRKGKTMTVISGLPLSQERLTSLAKQFKQQCGTGGTVKDDCIEIQGDHRDKLFDSIAKLGFKVKKSGG